MSYLKSTGRGGVQIRVALVYEGSVLTYGELNRRSNQLASLFDRVVE